jgi:hypothetical protein
MTTSETTTRNITGVLNPKRVGAYMKQSHKQGNSIRVQRREDGSFLIADGFVAVHVPPSPDLFPYTYFEASWERATFEHGNNLPSEGGPDIESMWQSWTSEDTLTLTLTHYLYEIAGDRNKPGHLYRKFAWYNLTAEVGETCVKKQICDMLSPDLGELEGFLFETTGKDHPVRVAAVYGYVAVMMPLVNKDR